MIDSPDEQTPELPHGLNLVLATAAITMANFINILDTTIATVAVPAISGGLAVTPSQGTWIITSYTACLAVVLPLSGWITRRFGEVRIFLIAFLLFTIMSLLCAAAPNFESLIVFRALQGFAGGLLLPLSQALMLKIYPKERHGLAVSIWALSSAVAPVVGPILGGYLTDAYGWPWIFYINVPVGIVSCYICWKLLLKFETTTAKDPVDRLGLILLVVGVLCLQLALDRGQELDWLDSNLIRSLLAVSSICVIFFIAWEHYEPHPIVDFSVFRYRDFSMGCGMYALIYVSFMLPQVLYPIWLQTVMGYTAYWAGLVMASAMVAPMFLMPLMGRYSTSYNPRPVVFLGSLLYAYSVLLHAQSSTDVSAAYIAYCRFVMGVGMACVFLPVMTLTMTSLPANKYSTGMGIFNFTRMIASSFGIAVGVSLWNQRTVVHRSQIVERLDSTLVAANEATGLLANRSQSQESTWSVIERMATDQATTLAMNDVFYVCVIMICSIAALCLFAPGLGSPSQRATINRSEC